MLLISVLFSYGSVIRVSNRGIIPPSIVVFGMFMNVYLSLTLPLTDQFYRVLSLLLSLLSSLHSLFRPQKAPFPGYCQGKKKPQCGAVRVGRHNTATLLL